MSNRKCFPYERANNVLDYLRVAHGLTMKELALVCQSSNQSVYRYVHGHYGPLAPLIKAARHFNVSLDCIVRNRFDGLIDVMPEQLPRKRRNTERMRANREVCDAIGDEGEELVLRRERERLAGSPYAKLVNGNFADDLRAGFDIMSFTADGEPIHIECKTSIDDKGHFYMSVNELRFANACLRHGLRYELHLIRNLRGKVKISVYSAQDVMTFHKKAMIYIMEVPA